jgi:hypothetical protein
MSNTNRCALLLLAVLFPALGHAEDTLNTKMAVTIVDRPRVFPNPEAAVAFGLKELRELAQSHGSDQEAYIKDLGFSSASEAAGVEAGIGLRTYEVSLERLRKFKETEDPVDVLIDIQEILIPLLVKGQPRSSFTIGEYERGKGWAVLKKGRATLTRLIEHYRTSNEDNLVAMSFLGLRFLGRRGETEQNDLMLISLVDRPALEIIAGTPILAKNLFLRLSKEPTIQHQSEYKRSRPKPE